MNLLNVFLFYFAMNDEWKEVVKPQTRNKKDRVDVFRELRIPSQNQSYEYPIIIILVGYPGSGKSTWSRKLEELSPHFVRMNQDELGSRNSCIQASIRALDEYRQNVIVDRCNVSKSQRRYFLDLAKSKELAIDCVWFDIELQECLGRIRQRQDHPNLDASNAERVLAMMRSEAQPPTLSEGFRSLHVVRTDEDMRSILERYL